MNVLRQSLVELRELLQACGEHVHLAGLSDALEGDDGAMNVYLQSNDLWGGSGSIADQACLTGRGETRKNLERLLIKLGNEQGRVGVVNVRTAEWVTVFEGWARERI
jgi:hypothetical protein